MMWIFKKKQTGMVIQVIPKVKKGELVFIQLVGQTEHTLKLFRDKLYIKRPDLRDKLVVTKYPVNFKIIEGKIKRTTM